MNTFLKFLYELLSQFFLGFKNIFTGLFTGLVAIFNVNKYISIIQDYKQDLSVGEWILVVIIMLIIVAILALIIFLFIILIKKIFKFKKTLVEQESLIEEIGDLNNKVATMMKEKEEISARINTRKYQPLQIRPMAMRSFFIFYLFQRKYQS